MKCVVGLDEVGRADVSLVGGKGANLGELRRLPGIRVPDGFCVTTAAFSEGRGISAQVEAAIGARLREGQAYAARSSATAEDLPEASFAGQQESFLSVTGLPAILHYISRCRASLDTDRAVAYRKEQGIDDAQMAVVVQEMLSPQAAGVMFTADPITGNRKVTAIEAVPGLGEALVSGHVNADSYKVREGQVTEKVGEVLTEAQSLQLAELGRRIEAHFGAPQDIEWCLQDGAFHFVQSRPITTLFPIPKADDDGFHVYVSVGHQQMMTDPMKPLGLSLWLLTAARPMSTAGGRLFVDVTAQMAAMVNILGQSDPLIRDALTTLVERGLGNSTPAAPFPNFQPPVPEDPAVVAELIANGHAAVEALRQGLKGKSGAELLDYLLEDVQHLKQSLPDPKSFAAIMAGMNAATWLNEHMLKWLGEKNAADTLAQSVPHNPTSAMGLELLDVADAVRPHPEVIAYLQTAPDEGFLEGLLPLEGGREAHAALEAYLDKYGMRCVGEIDVTRTRWSESPTTLVPSILSHVKNFEPGAGRRKFAEGLEEAASKERELLGRLEAARGEETRQKIRQLRDFSGYREYPKYFIISRYFLYKRALLEEGRRLGLEPEDLYHLTLQELREGKLDRELIRQRKAEHQRNLKLRPPRVLTSEGEMLNGAYRRDDLPPGALVGLAVSTGVVEGRARVLADVAEAQLEAGDILVTAFTDPSWTPLFVTARGLVTEVGGLMTHGAVIAREYGLPAVVGVVDATRLIRDGQRIRVNGTDGYVELL